MFSKVSENLLASVWCQFGSVPVFLISCGQGTEITNWFSSINKSHISPWKMVILYQNIQTK